MFSTDAIIAQSIDAAQKENPNKNEPAITEEMSADSLVTIHQGASTAYVAIVAQLSELREEIANLKKSDRTATEKLRHLNELLQQKAEGRRQTAEGK